MIPVDSTGRPLHRAVVWLDGRASEQARQVAACLSPEEFHWWTGLPEVNGFTPLAKLLWFRDCLPQVYRKAEYFLLLEDYLLFCMTGKFVTEKSLQSSTGWFNLREDEYWSDLLSKLGLDLNKLPELRDCGEIIGHLTAESAARMGLTAGIPVVTGAMDQIAAALGGQGLQSHSLTATVGTAMALSCATTAEQAFSRTFMTIYRGLQPRQFVLLPYCPTAGAVFKWLKDTVCAGETALCRENGQNIYDYLCAMAQDIPPGANGVILLPYFASSLQPRSIDSAKGVFFGLDLNTDRAVLVRAVLEAVGYLLRENLELLAQLNIYPTQIAFFGGGSKNQVWNQIIADITGHPLTLLEQEECGSLGAAMLAAAVLGHQPDLKAAQQKNKIRTVIYPDPGVASVYEESYRKYLSLFDAVEHIFL